MKITLFDANADMVAAWEKTFAGIPDVEIMHCDLTDLPRHEALVTAGNCFAVMTGGIDLAVRELMGYELQDALQNYILSLARPLFVGEVILVKFEEDDAPFGSVIYAPTMHSPRPIGSTEVFGATYAALTSAIHNGLRQIAIPGMGTGVGKVPVDLAAQAMRDAYDAAMVRAKHQEIRRNDHV